MDLDWRAILNKAIDIGGPIAAKVVDFEAPGVGTAISAGLPILKQQVVDKYVPGKEPPPAVPPPASSAGEPTEAKTAVAFLRKQGWSHEEATEHLKGPQSEPEEEPDEHERIAALVSRALDEAGWSPTEKQALLRGPSALGELCQMRKEEVPKREAVAPKSGHVDNIIYFGKRK